MKEGRFSVRNGFFATSPGKANEIGRHWDIDIDTPDEEDALGWIDKIRMHGSIDVTLS